MPKYVIDIDTQVPFSYTYPINKQVIINNINILLVTHAVRQTERRCQRGLNFGQGKLTDRIALDVKRGFAGDKNAADIEE